MAQEQHRRPRRERKRPTRCSTSRARRLRRIFRDPAPVEHARAVPHRAGSSSRSRPSPTTRSGTSTRSTTAIGTRCASCSPAPSRISCGGFGGAAELGRHGRALLARTTASSSGEHGGLYHNHSLFDEEVRVPGFILAGAHGLAREAASRAARLHRAAHVHAGRSRDARRPARRPRRGDLRPAVRVARHRSRAHATRGRRRTDDVSSRRRRAYGSPDDARFGAMRGELLAVASSATDFSCYLTAATRRPSNRRSRRRPAATSPTRRGAPSRSAETHASGKVARARTKFLAQPAARSPATDAPTARISGAVSAQIPRLRYGCASSSCSGRSSAPCTRSVFSRKPR